MQDLSPRYHSVVAILTVGRRYALQLRDKRPGIAEPGRWSLFGGVVRRGEHPEHAIRRELHEELHLRVDDLAELWRVRYYSSFRRAVARVVVFTGDVTDNWECHRLGEGQRVALFTIARLPPNTVPLAQALLDRHAWMVRRRRSPS
jgi:8-oxo-dGTP pyrophosphatase MutT (NUDIX family)